jgi:hypothetical protein
MHGHGHGHGIFILATYPEGTWSTNPCTCNIRTAHQTLIVARQYVYKRHTPHYVRTFHTLSRRIPHATTRAVASRWLIHTPTCITMHMIKLERTAFSLALVDPTILCMAWCGHFGQKFGGNGRCRVWCKHVGMLHAYSMILWKSEWMALMGGKIVLREYVGGNMLAGICWREYVAGNIVAGTSYCLHWPCSVSAL